MACDPCAAAGSLVYTNDAAQAGVVEKLGDLECYNVNVGSSTAVVIGTDIFGFGNSNMRANADMLAKSMGCTVCVPDHFRGRHAGELDLSNPATAGANIGAFVREHGAFERAKSDLTTQVVPYLKSKGATNLFYLGFCWGGIIALALVADDELAPHFRAAGGIHASLKDPEGDLVKARAAKLPLMLLQADNDADVRPLHAALRENPEMASKHVVRTYHDQQHGWCGARGDRSQPRIAAAVRSALQTTMDFFAASNL